MSNTTQTMKLKIANAKKEAELRKAESEAADKILATLQKRSQITNKKNWSASEISRHILNSSISYQKIYSLLEEKNVIQKVDGKYVPTEKGKDYITYKADKKEPKDSINFQLEVLGIIKNEIISLMKNEIETSKKKLTILEKTLKKLSNL